MVFSQYESKKRVSAEEAMKHVYFRCLGPRIHALPESKRNCTRQQMFGSKLLMVPVIKVTQNILLTYKINGV